MLLEAAALTFLVAQYVYHRWFEDKPLDKAPPQDTAIPRLDDGAPVPLIYGRVRVRAPILAWHSTPIVVNGNGGSNTYPVGSKFYQLRMLFVLGVPFDDGKGINKVHGMWNGERRMGPFSNGYTKETPFLMSLGAGVGIDVGTIGEFVEFYDGNAAQTPTTHNMGIGMLAAGMNINSIPEYRGYISAFLFNGDGLADGWYAGTRPNIAAYSFEVSSYRDGGGYPAVGINAQIGQDSNPVNALYDIYRAKFGKLGIDAATRIDIASWQKAATTLAQESHGYSRCIEDRREASEYEAEILKQIDGVVRENPATGKLELKLIRNDYDPTTIPRITPDNCKALVSPAAGGWTNIVNKVRLVFTNRGNETVGDQDYLADYADGSETAQNAANAVGQDGIINEQVIEMRGVCYRSLARKLAARELAARSRPLMKFRAIVDRSFYRVMQGDAVKVVWTKPAIAGLVFRVANVERGTLEDGMIALDLIQDFFYVWRDQAPLVNHTFGNDIPVVVMG